MQSSHLFRASLYTIVCLATLGLWLGEDNPWPYPWLVILCAVAAYAFTDQWDMLVIPSAVAPWLGIVAVALFIREEVLSYRVDPVLPLGHLIVFLQVILMFHRKKPSYYWGLIFMSFLEMAIAALHNNRLTFGVLMGAYLAMTVWTLTQFLLVRETERYQELAGCLGSSLRDPSTLGRPNCNDNRLGSRRLDPRHPRVKRAAARSFGSSLVILAAALLLFLVIPRRGQTAWTQPQYRPGQFLSGFDDRIRLGQLGTILESDEEVMVVRLSDESGVAVVPSDEPYWRGVALTNYQGGRWERRVDLPSSFARVRNRPERLIRQEIRLQAFHRDVLFGLRPIFNAYTRAGEPLGLMRLDGTLVRPETVPSGALQYTVESAADSRIPQPGENRADQMLKDQYYRSELTQVPDGLRDQLRQYVAQLNPPSVEDPFVLSEFLLAHLQDPKQFDYTLNAAVSDPEMDPVLDFLLNRKEGHCEYFASALALMLRAHGVSARVVNGFKGGDWNEILGPSVVVRQKHAHSWVEAILRTPDRPEPHWVTLDPTPGQGRQRLVAMVNPTPTLLRQIRDASRQVWSSYVLNFNYSEQEAAIYGPMRRVVSAQAERIVAAVQALREGGPGGFNWLAAVVTSGGTAALILLLRLLVRLAGSGKLVWAENGQMRRPGFLAWCMHRMRRLLTRWLRDRPALRSRVVFYEQLLEILESHGRRKQPSWTPQQFAQQVGQELGLAPQTLAVARIPVELVHRYYHVRFGHARLSSQEAGEIGRMLGELMKALSVETLRR